MNKFDIHHINEEAFFRLEDYVDNFSKIAHIKTDLMFGNTAERKEDIYLSLIIPTFNRSSLLEEAIHSALRQQAVPYAWELIVVDNTELDENNETPALRIIQGINDDRVLYYHNRVNVGSGYNWNRGVELARGRWVSFLHDDDLLCSDALVNIGKIIKNYNGKKRLGYIHAHRVKFSGEFDENKAKRKRWPVQLQLTQRLALIYGHTGTGAPSCGTTILKEAYIEVGGINYDFGPTADAVLGYQIMKNYAVIRSSEVLGGYRWADNETCKKDTIQSLLRSDKLFACYRYEGNFFGEMWGRIFADVIEYNNWVMKKRLLENSKSVQKPKMGKFFLIRKAVYTGCFYGYMFMMVIKSILHYQKKDYLGDGFCE